MKFNCIFIMDKRKDKKKLIFIFFIINIVFIIYINVSNKIGVKYMYNL